MTTKKCDCGRKQKKNKLLFYFILLNVQMLSFIISFLVNLNIKHNIIYPTKIILRIKITKIQ